MSNKIEYPKFPKLFRKDKELNALVVSPLIGIATIIAMAGFFIFCILASHATPPAAYLTFPQVFAVGAIITASYFLIRDQIRLLRK